jgi:hypothetical protein
MMSTDYTLDDRDADELRKEAEEGQAEHDWAMENGWGDNPVEAAKILALSWEADERRASELRRLVASGRPLEENDLIDAEILVDRRVLPASFLEKLPGGA